MSNGNGIWFNIYTHRAFLVVKFDVTSGKPVFKDAYVTTQHPKPVFGLLHMFPLKCKATSPGIAVREIYRMIEADENWAWVRPYLKLTKRQILCARGDWNVESK